MVRQRWDKWNIDEVYPMIYHNFIMKKLIDRICTKQAVTDLKHTKIELTLEFICLDTIRGGTERSDCISQRKWR
jgi:hypothetical protein